MSLRELQFCRVHKASLHKGAGLASALTRIFRIDKAAIVAQILVEVAARTGEDLAEICRSHLGDLGAHLIAHLKDLPKNEDESLAAVQAKQRTDHAVVLGLFNQDFDWDWHSLRVGRSRSGTCRSPADAMSKEQIASAVAHLGFFTLKRWLTAMR